MKTKILIASFLKPVTDIRSYEKIAKSLAQNPAYKIYCTGYPSNIELTDKQISLLPLRYFNKSGFLRIIARWQVVKIYLKVKPQVIIVNSPDLLIFTCIYKILFGGHIVYDIRENYFNNLWYQNNYAWGIKHILAVLVRLKELITSPLFCCFFLAEKVYASQLNFIGNRFLVLENKSITTENKVVTTANLSNPTFIISGTIAKEYGTLKAVNFFQLLQSTLPKSKLIIIGHCPNLELQNTLINIVKRNSNIQLSISGNPVPYVQIKTALLQANFGLLAYQNNKSINGKWPTKLYEYMGINLPVIIQDNNTWNSFIIENNAGVIFNFNKLTKDNCSSKWKQLMQVKFFTKGVPSSIFWEQEEDKLLRKVEDITGQ